MQCQSIYIFTEILIRDDSCLTDTSWQYVAPDASASSQTCDLAVSFKSVAIETSEGQRVANSKSESHPPAVRWYPGILTWL